MTDKMLAAIGSAFPLTELDCGEYAALKVSGMNFTVRRFAAERLGSVSVMRAKGFFGLMKMDTLIITPTQADMPLLSYDRVLAMGNDTLIFELYDTLLGECNLMPLAEEKKAAASLPDHDLGAHWYNSIKLPESFAKKGKKQHTAAFDAAAERYLAAYLACAKQAAACESEPKREKAAVYVNGLLEQGGPSTDVFMKGIGKEKTADLFRRVLFASEA